MEYEVSYQASPALIIVWLIVAVVLIAAMWKVFAKAGQPGWAALVPIYNMIVLLQIVGRPTWWLLLYFVPIVNIFIGLMVINDLSKSFGKGIGFTLGLIFLSPIFWCILGFGPAQYIGPGAKL